MAVKNPWLNNNLVISFARNCRQPNRTTHACRSWVAKFPLEKGLRRVRAKWAPSSGCEQWWLRLHGIPVSFKCSRHPKCGQHQALVSHPATLSHSTRLWYAVVPPRCADSRACETGDTYMALRWPWCRCGQARLVRSWHPLVCASEPSGWADSQETECYLPGSPNSTPRAVRQHVSFWFTQLLPIWQRKCQNPSTAT